MEMQEKKLKRFNVYAIIAKVLFILTLIAGSIGFVVAIAAEGLLIAKGTEILSELQEFIVSMGFDYTLPINEVPHMLVIIGIVFLIASTAITAYILRAISKMFRNTVDTKTPFHTDNIKRIRSMGIALFIYSGIQVVLGAVMSYKVMDVLGNPSFMDHISINWTLIGFGILLLALAEMFEYGSSLQQDSQSIV